MGATSAQRNTAIQAVDVYLNIDGKEVRAIIPREVFEGRLRSPDGPEAWLKSYEFCRTACFVPALSVKSST